MNADPIKCIVKYETTSALYAGQTIVNAIGEEVIVDFSSGPIPGQEEQVLPIHTRIALSAESARRLARLLTQATSRQSNDEARLPGTYGATHESA